MIRPENVLLGLRRWLASRLAGDETRCARRELIVHCSRQQVMDLAPCVSQPVWPGVWRLPPWWYDLYEAAVDSEFVDEAADIRKRLAGELTGRPWES